ncbi:MAG: hypothetical protein WBG09_19315 [Candidatus Sulfotelmatobacter sp.]
MNPSDDQPITIDALPAATDQNETSQRKVNANQKNSLKSTGPNTTRGKSYSRRNALKHGLFDGLLSDFISLGELKQNYDRLLDDLNEHFEPIGRAEELEVERMRLCWWRLQRVWCYENSENRSSIDRVLTELEQIEKSCKKQDEEREAIIVGLRKMYFELMGAAEVPPDLMDRFFVLTSAKAEDWGLYEDLAKDRLKKESQDPAFAENLSTPESRRKRLAEETLGVAIGLRSIKQEAHAAPNTMKSILGLHAIPNSDALDKILRYETAIERSLDRALNRLERLQRRRKGEPVLPPVNLQVT